MMEIIFRETLIIMIDRIFMVMITAIRVYTARRILTISRFRRVFGKRMIAELYGRKAITITHNLWTLLKT